jgi:hypothetical protein
MPHITERGCSNESHAIGVCPSHGAWWQMIGPRSVRPSLSGACVPGHGARVKRLTYPRRKTGKGICGMGS